MWLAHPAALVHALFLLILLPGCNGVAFVVTTKYSKQNCSAGDGDLVEDFFWPGCISWTGAHSVGGCKGHNELLSKCPTFGEEEKWVKVGNNYTHVWQEFFEDEYCSEEHESQKTVMHKIGCTNTGDTSESHEVIDTEVVYKMFYDYRDRDCMGWWGGERLAERLEYPLDICFHGKKSSSMFTQVGGEVKLFQYEDRMCGGTRDCTVREGLTTTAPPPPEDGEEIPTCRWDLSCLEVV